MNNEETGGSVAKKTLAPKEILASKQASMPQSQPKGEAVQAASGEAAQAKTQVKAVPATKPVVKKKIVKVVKVKSPTSNTVAKKISKSAEAVKGSGEDKQDVSNVIELTKEEDLSASKPRESPEKEETSLANVKEEPALSKVDEAPKEEPVVAEVVKSANVEEDGVEIEEKELNYFVQVGSEYLEDAKESESVDMVEDHKEVGDKEDAQGEEVEHMTDEEGEGHSREEVAEEAGDEEHAEDDVSEPDEEAAGLEHMEMSAIASERKIKKAQEIFIGGLDRDTVEGDIRKVFKNMGEILEIRMQRHPTTNKNKGFAFVKFADKEQAARALSELKDPVIRGKPCGIAPSEDKNTLFLGNICNTWTREAIKKKLKSYGVEGVENITLVPDARDEGFSKGFAFLEFSCHADAMLAYKRLQKPDVIFGHAERTAKVAFAEPLRDPDPEVMAQVKSVFVNGLPPHWDEERVREHFKVYGEIEGTMLARNKPFAKRRDFGFVNFTTHEAAVACVAGADNTELGDDKSKAKMKVRLSNPLPKTQAVKGGIRGGFWISHYGTFSRFGRGSGRDECPLNKANSQHGKGYLRGQPERFALADGRRGSSKNIGFQAAPVARPDLSRPKHGAPGRGHGQSLMHRRQQFLAEGNFGKPYGRRHLIDDQYMYNDRRHGIKRSFYMVEEESGYLEPSRLRRIRHSDLQILPRESQYEVGAGSGFYSPDYYGSDYGHSAYPSTYGLNHSFKRGYY